jgi:hypothetical protein
MFMTNWNQTFIFHDKYVGVNTALLWHFIGVVPKHIIKHRYLLVRLDVLPPQKTFILVTKVITYIDLPPCI